MSLTSFVERKDVRTRLTKVLPEYRRTLRVPLLVPSQGANPGLVGTAFDYAFRFEMQRRNAAARESPWVAEASVREMLRVSGRERRLRFLGHMAREAVPILSDAKTFVGRYATLKAPTNRQRRLLAHHSVRLARLDVFYRAGLWDGLLDAPTPAEVAEVAALAALVPSYLGQRGRISLNPNFGEFSALVGGADADVFLGSTIVDIKTVRMALVEKYMVRQLVGYLILARAARRAGRRLPNFDRLAIYFSRHAYVWELPVDPIVTHPAWVATERWFLTTAKKSEW